jgi:hypothetical protein
MSGQVKALFLLVLLCSCVSLSACSLWSSGKASPTVVRKAQETNEQQKEIDDLRKEIYDSTKYGGGEVKSWNERYKGQNTNSPYQGPTSGSYR